MGLKEKAQSIRGGKLMASFFVAEALDTAMTAIALNHYSGTEISPFGGQELLQNWEQNEVFILKTAVATVLIGIYALSSIHEKTVKRGSKVREINFKRAMEVTLQGANAFAWGVVAFNSVNLAPDVINKIFNG